MTCFRLAYKLSPVPPRAAALSNPLWSAAFLPFDPADLWPLVGEAITSHFRAARSAGFSPGLASCQTTEERKRPCVRRIARRVVNAPSGAAASDRINWEEVSIAWF